MPRDFSDMESLVQVAPYYKCRQPDPGETLKEYRKVLAKAALPVDQVEAAEIYFGVGWNKIPPGKMLAFIQGGTP